MMTKTIKKKFRSVLFLFTVVVSVGCVVNQSTSTVGENIFAENRILQVDACDLNGNRQALTKVDIGYGDRAYFGYTNEHKQLVRVEANEIILQSKDERLTKKGRYCKDEAKVAGVKRDGYDEGHIIADSLGGVSNAYNITPQVSQLNREGIQAQMEEGLRQALYKGKKVTDFVAIIEYPDTPTQIPLKYHFEFKVNGKLNVFDFENK